MLSEMPIYFNLARTVNNGAEEQDLSKDNKCRSPVLVLLLSNEYASIQVLGVC